ncbi:50S ribosomal protein L4 [Candidatus Micrarchaeota archaeon]|nr:50S ribosomal protein L4 [Candidatus Micrarchaeota archaeon]
MKASIYSIDGKAGKEVQLPACFEEAVREDLIKRAVLSDESKLFQPKGNYPFAGKETSAKYKGRKEDFGSLKNQGQAKLPREVGAKGQPGKVKYIPSAVKGRRAHPPKVEKILVERMNEKEYKKALRSAIAATMDVSLARKRGHEFDAKSLPFVVDSAFEKIAKTKDMLSFFEKLGLAKDLLRARNKAKTLSGTRRKRSKSKQVPKSLLIVVKDGAALKAARNLPGVDIVKASELKAMHLAPGTHPGRLAIFSESALEVLKNF